MKTNNNNSSHSVYFMEHALCEYPDNLSEKIIQKRRELEKQINEARSKIYAEIN